MATTRDRTLKTALEQVGEDTTWQWDRLPQQEAFLTSLVPFTCFSGGFGTGKTTALVAKVLLMLTAIPNNLGYLGRQDGKALRASTIQTLDDILPKDYIAKRDNQQGFLQLKAEVGGGRLIFGDFKDINDLKNIPLGFYAIDQMEEVSEDVWKYLAGRIRRRTPLLTVDNQKQFYVKGSCPSNTVDQAGRHYALEGDKLCKLCTAPLPPFAEVLGPGEEVPPWDLIIYNRYGFGVCNPEGPSHWIFKYFKGLPGQHGISDGKPDHIAFHATAYDGLRAGYTDIKYIRNMENIYATSKLMWDRYLEGKWVEADGLVYPAWNRGTHVYQWNEIRYNGQPVIHDKGYVFEYIDHGLTSATAVGWVFVERCDCGCNRQNYFLLDEHYEGGKTVSYHAAQIKAHRARLTYPIIQATYLDSQAFSKTLMGSKGTKRADELYSVADEYADYDIYAIPNQKDWKVGYNRFSELLAHDPSHVHPFTGERGAPHFYSSNINRFFTEEIETHKWKVVRNAHEPSKDEPVDGHDHHMDGFNGFLASRPAEIAEYVPEKEDSFDLELEIWANPSGHMSA